MDKQLIKNKVANAYRQAKSYPDFMDRFKVEVQAVIDSFVPSDVTHPWHVNRDIDHLSEISKARGYKVRGFLMLIVNYVSMIIVAYEKGDENINFEGQYDMFDDNITDEEE